MGCQREIAKQIAENGGDYILSLKGNQGSLHEAVKDFFNIAEAKEYIDVKYNFLEEVDKGHGRVETRRYWITSHLATIPKVENWNGLTSIGMVERTCWANGKETQKKRYFICSISNNAKLFAKAVREHWGIENKLHWRLDVIFKEDANTQRKFSCYSNIPIFSYHKFIF
ncbi:MAG: ISAs1 family transposase [Candidatus Marithrix sp.]